MTDKDENTLGGKIAGFLGLHVAQCHRFDRTTVIPVNTGDDAVPNELHFIVIEGSLL